MKFEAALDISNEIDYKEGSITILNNIGIIHKARGNYNIAIDNYRKVLEIRKELGKSPHLVIHSFNNE